MQQKKIQKAKQLKDKKMRLLSGEGAAAKQRLPGSAHNDSCVLRRRQSMKIKLPFWIFAASKGT